MFCNIYSVRNHLSIYSLFISSFSSVSQYSTSYSHTSWFQYRFDFFLCDCFDNDFMFDIIVFKTFQRIYQIHHNHFFCCKWYLQIEQTRDNHAKQIRQIEQIRLIEQQQQQNQSLNAQLVENVMQFWKNSWKNSWKKLIQQQVEKARLEKKRQTIEKIKTKTFFCKRCFAKYFNNIKFHEHIRDHHTKKSKFVVSSSFISFISFFISFVTSFESTIFSESIIFLFDNSKFASQSKILFISFFSSFRSIIVSSKFLFITIKISFLSNFASEFVFKRLKNASFIFQKFVTMRSTFFFKSIFETSSKFYFIIKNLDRMFVEKNMKTKLFAIQNNFFSSNIFVFRQTRIILYFLFVVKSTKFEIFTSMYDSIKQSIRVSFLRFFSFYFSTRFLFSTIFYFFFVCWRCQESFVICLSRNWIDFIVAKVEIFMKRRERRFFF